MTMERPAGVIAIAIVFFAVAAYLLLLAAVMLFAPGSVSMRLGAPFLGGLELAGPYAFLIAGAIAAVVGYGLLRLNNWARRAAALIALIGVIFLVPTVSSAVVSARWLPLAWGALGVISRVVIAWYLYQMPVIEQFETIATE
jgi:hypothetical protein